MKVLLLYTGDVERNAFVQIVGSEEDEFLALSPSVPNSQETGIHELFPGGIAV